MPTPPYAKILVSVGGGGPQSGGIICAGGEAIQLSAESTVSWQSAIWEIFATRGAIATPAGWTYDATKERFYYAGTTLMPPFTLAAKGPKPAKYMLRLTINGATTDKDSPDYDSTKVDEATAIAVPSLSGFHGAGFREEGQFDAIRRWCGQLEDDLILSSENGGIGLKLNADFTTTSASAVSTPFAIPVKSGEIWEIEFEGSVQCSGTGGTRYDIDGPATSTVEGWLDSSTSAITTKSYQRISAISTQTGTAVHTVAATLAPDRIRATVIAAADGNLTLRAWSVTAGQTTTIKAGSRCVFRKLKGV